ncbi:ADP,ATP carrier [Micractinium conductrix]|uniref:ADP,ATP carrier n=1 Tax=Micractinium conductrix TaxID=554055 RepID=A0A2P6V181_9CHLO|nr:ADP,ATP carrier [Micractinium conductrix]|eukprot:PSC67852.1 ADP,ATP carrier [Micractinium conductrix]
MRRALVARAEWVLGRGYHAREAFCNAIYMTPNWSKAVLLLLAERVTRGDPRFAWCYSTPVAESEEQLFEATEAERAGLSLLQRAHRAAASLLRLAVLLVLFSPVVLSAALVGDYLGISRKRWLRLLRRTLEVAGPAFIKWGQWAATRHDIFPPDFCDELELLHSQAPAHALPFTEAAVREAFGFSVKDLFAEFDAEPVASGSIGQIHRGALSGTGARLTGMKPGTVVAVKVRHPGVSEAIERDFALMMAAARLFAHLPALSSLRLEESLTQFAAPLREQVDLAREATHLHAFNYNFRKTAGVSFPVPLYPLVQPAVLVETFEAGTHISSYVSRGPGAPHNSELARLGARTMLHMMIVDNLIHADLHPGNILVTLDFPLPKPLAALVSRGAAAAASLGLDTSWLEGWRRASLVLLDAGMAMRLSPTDQRNMFGLFESFAEMDGGRVADWTLRFSGEEQSCPDPAAFKADVASFFDRLNAESAATGATHGADALADVLEMVRTHQVNMPGHICATVVTTMVLEGWSNKLDPNHSTLQEVKRMVQAAKGGLLGRLTEIMLRGELAADSEIMERVELLEPALIKIQ